PVMTATLFSSFIVDLLGVCPFDRRRTKSVTGSFASCALQGWRPPCIGLCLELTAPSLERGVTNRSAPDPRQQQRSLGWVARDAERSLLGSARQLDAPELHQQRAADCVK